MNEGKDDHSPASRVGAGLLGIMIIASIGLTEWKGGFPWAISMHVIPRDHTSALPSYLKQQQPMIGRVKKKGRRGKKLPRFKNHFRCHPIRSASESVPLNGLI